MTFQVIIGVFAGYLIGAIPFGVIVSKLWRGIDIRQYGSGNIGFANVMRVLGPLPGFIVLITDAFKGFAAVWVAKSLLPGNLILHVLAAFLCIFGHTHSVFLKFGGGKGIATSFGVLLGLNYWAALISLLSWTVLVLSTRYVSLGSIAGGISVPISMWLFTHKTPYIIFGLMVTIIVLISHQANIKRLIQGKEFKIGQKVTPDSQEKQDSET